MSDVKVLNSGIEVLESTIDRLSEKIKFFRKQLEEWKYWNRMAEDLSLKAENYRRLGKHEEAKKAYEESKRCKNEVKKIQEEHKEWYLFCWDEIPEKDNGRLIEFLKTNFDADWARTAKIEKIDGNTIRISTENNSISLRLNNGKTNVNLKINDGRIDDFIAKMEKGKLNIYEEWKLGNLKNNE